MAETTDRCARDSDWCDGVICRERGIDCPYADPVTETEAELADHPGAWRCQCGNLWRRDVVACPVCEPASAAGGAEYPPLSLAEWQRRVDESQARSERARAEAERLAERALMPRGRRDLAEAVAIAVVAILLFALLATVFA